MAKSIIDVTLVCFVLLSSQSLLVSGASSKSLQKSDFSAPKTGFESKFLGLSQGSPLKFQTFHEKTFRKHYSSKAMGRTNYVQPGNKMPLPGQKTRKAPKIKDPCDRYDVDGCSIPFHLPFFYKKLFTPSCNRHDICYHCGVDYGDNRLKCDQEFKKNMMRSCDLKGYMLKPWNGSGFRNQFETRIHRQRMQTLIDINTSILDDISEWEFRNMKNEFDEAINSLKSPEHLASLQKSIILKWTLLLSSNIRSDDGSKSLYQDNKTNRISDQMKSTYFAIDLLSVLTNQRGEPRSYRNEPSRKVSSFTESASARLSEPHSDVSDPISIIDSTKSCEQILREADKVSMSLQKYRVSDVVDCEDVRLLACHNFANIYYLAVREFGGSSYKKKAEFYCHEKFVPGCLPKS